MSTSDLQVKRKSYLLVKIVMVLIIILGIEVGLHIIYQIRGSGESAKKPQHLLSPYRDKPWAEDMFKEFNSIEENYEPFLGWDRREYQGRYINVDAQGLRKTWNPDHIDMKGAKTIYFFGGSTVWGTGARDEYTIPSFLSKLLNQNSAQYVVKNFGETGYTFLQEVIHLVLLLREGHRPDFVFFYDGMNDVYASYQEGKLETTQNVSDIREKLQLRPIQQIGIWIKKFFMRYSMIVKMMMKFYYIASAQPNFQEETADFSDAKLQSLSTDIVESYTQTRQLLKDLSHSYGFQFMTLWQPLIFTEETLTDEEENVSIRLADKNLGKLIYMVMQGIEGHSFDHFRNLTTSIRDREESYYIDCCHLAEKGNQRVAESIYEIFLKQFPSSQ